MDFAEQKQIVQMWLAFKEDAPTTPALMRQFYLERVKPSELYRYGVAF